jgi:hypothetical protein
MPPAPNPEGYVTMVCWRNAGWWDGTNRWFEVNSAWFGEFWMNADQVGGQQNVRAC